jgi:hypothetical protein
MSSAMDKSIENIVFMVFMLLIVVGGLAAFATYEYHKEKEH